MRKLFALIALLYCTTFYSYSNRIPETIDILIFGGENLTRFSLTPTLGNYHLVDHHNRVLMKLEFHNTIHFRSTAHGIEIIRNDSVLFRRDTIIVRGISFANSFMVRPANNNTDYRVYDGNLIISQANNIFRLINRSPLESYVAGTVQSEAGFNRHNVFYQVQAIIIRTYAMRNLNRHRSEGFSLCDRVHCQAYYGKTFDPDIIAAVEHTRGEVVVDQNSALLNTVYHANCGGETVNSEDLWVQAMPYLRSRIDTFCLHKPGARWTATIPVAEFRSFLHNTIGQKPSENLWEEITQKRQNSRVHFLDATRQIPLRRVREHFRLRSTFFDITQSGQMLQFTGRGFGHGVGLCQEGAMERARHGHTREQILNFYYQNTRIIILEPTPNIDQLAMP